MTVVRRIVAAGSCCSAPRSSETIRRVRSAVKLQLSNRHQLSRWAIDRKLD